MDKAEKAAKDKMTDEKAKKKAGDGDPPVGDDLAAADVDMAHLDGGDMDVDDLDGGIGLHGLGAGDDADLEGDFASFLMDAVDAEDEKQERNVEWGGKRSPGAVSVGADEGVGAEKRRGRCKWFNVAKGWGFISPDDGGQDIFVHQSVVQMSGFRSLGDDEEVEFECKVSDKGLEATVVTGPDGTDCQGSHRRPAAKKRFRKIRCYNCGEFANHIAAKCTMGPQPKRCHHCKSEDHLIADCPTRKEKKEGEKEEGKEGEKKAETEIKEEKATRRRRTRRTTRRPRRPRRATTARMPKHQRRPLSSRGNPPIHSESVCVYVCICVCLSTCRLEGKPLRVRVLVLCSVDPRSLAAVRRDPLVQIVDTNQKECN
ncbi:protein lin-28 homolog isoform X2 [Thrips palmi]|uniref:Protein lin-28 homolog isoform X2 n=1 Tax=Thrips palmi TaxID=161013 RepID=A0A6P8YWY7_THRPL|nr:protein lin-28 homolog isoform X2 [Thrips palmi]